MSYSLGATPSRASEIRVGTRASKDPILARASYEAARILLRSTYQPRSDQKRYVDTQMMRYGAGTKKRLDSERLRLIASGVAPNQATFDAMRLIIANHYTQLGVEAIQAALARTNSAEALSGRDEELVGCAVTGGVTAVVGSILGAYTGGVGAQAMAVGGQLVGGALDCSREQREHEMRMAEARAAEAQAMADAAAARAEEESRLFSPEMAKNLKIGGIVLGSIAAIGLLGFVIVKV